MKDVPRFTLNVEPDGSGEWGLLEADGRRYGVCADRLGFGFHGNLEALLVDALQSLKMRASTEPDEWDKRSDKDKALDAAIFGKKD